MKFSPQQEAFLNWAANGSGSCVLRSVAGSGKTTTILEAVRRMRGQCAIVAFGKDIAEEIKAKLTNIGVDWKKAQAGTVHSFGFNALRKQFPNIKVNQHKVEELITAAIERGELQSLRAYASTIVKLISLAKLRAVGVLTRIDDRDAYHDIIDHFDLSDDIEDDDGLPSPVEAIINAAIKFLRISNQITSEVDYDDMVYLPLILKCRFWQFDNVFVDEAQDTNPSRRALVRALLRRGGRVIAVGDEHQAVFGFTGADSDSLDLIAQDFNAKNMALSVTYRCPKNVVAFAKQWVDHIEAAETAPDGAVGRSTFEDFIKRTDLDGTASVLCRNTKPLVACAFALIRARIPCRIEGREIGTGLTKLATRWSRVKTISALTDKLAEHLDRQTTKLLAKKQESKLQAVEDQVETLRVIMDRCREENRSRVADVVEYIEGLFADKVSGMLTLSTIHKAKGREWQRVFWLDRVNTCPSKYARQHWQQEQEVNLCYVAATRAQGELIDLEAAPERERAPAPQKPAKEERKAA